MENRAKYRPPKHISRSGKSDYLLLLIGTMAAVTIMTVIGWPFSGMVNSFVLFAEMFIPVGLLTGVIMLFGNYLDHAFWLSVGFWAGSTMLDGWLVSETYKGLTETQSFEVSAIIIALIEVIVYLRVVSPAAKERDREVRINYPYKAYLRDHPELDTTKEDVPEWVHDLSFEEEARTRK